MTSTENVPFYIKISVARILIIYKIKSDKTILTNYLPMNFSHEIFPYQLP